MDTRYFGNNLLALNQSAADCRRVWTEVEEDAYYRGHLPGKQRRVPRVGVVMSGIVVGLLTVKGSLLFPLGHKGASIVGRLG
jgi:hypothetical protein